MTRPTLHRGKLAKAPRVLEVRPLVREDLAVLQGERAPQSRVKSLRAHHHRIAYMLAAKMTTTEIMQITGYSRSRIQQLSNDPAVQQLMAEYEPDAKGDAHKVIDEFARRKFENAMMAEELISEHLYEALETGILPAIKNLLPITQDYADRFGYGKHTSQTSEVKDYAKALELAMARDGRSSVIDARAPKPAPALASIPAEPPAQPPAAPQGNQSDAAFSVGIRRRV